MLNATEKQIMPRVNVTCVNTDKFKTGCISVNLITQLDRENAAKNALLPRVLRRGTARQPDMESLAAALDELYGARVTPLTRKKGELQCVGFFADFIDDDYTPKGENVLEKTAALLGELLLSPLTRGGLLTGDYVEGEKKNLIDEIRAGINDKRAYAVDRLLENMCADEAFGVNKLGGEEAARAITARTLTAHYQSLIASAEVEVFYCGTASPERVVSAVREALAGLPRGGSLPERATEIRRHAPADAPRRFTESLDVSQGKLALGFRLGEAMYSPNYAAFAVFNALFGGSVTSKLFLNVREKLSLCYYASSVIEKHKGVMVVSSGVEFAKFDAALTEILAQLDAIRRGEVSDWEFVSAKRAVITTLKAALDRPS
ncbi:MAG: insulinase family protein, partial [Oscillospiraceae bacterium]|nr:insulinase family protein [Oscillospiraceae bacterium]